MKKELFFSSLLLMSASLALGQTNAYVYVQQNGTKVEADGTATCDVSSTDAELSFDAYGNAIMTIGGQKVAQLPVTDGNGGELCADFTSSGSISASVDSKGYATYYSPFRLSVGTTSGTSVYAPTYDSGTHVLNCTTATQAAEGSIIPIGTGLLLKNEGTVTFELSTNEATVSKGDLSGSALAITKPTPASGVIYTLGYKTGATETAANFGFYEYSGTNLNPAKAYLIAERLNSDNARNYISIGEDETTGICNANLNLAHNGKYIEDGRVVILKSGKKYNLNGQEVK